MICRHFLPDAGTYVEADWHFSSNRWFPEVTNGTPDGVLIIFNRDIYCRTLILVIECRIRLLPADYQ